MNTPTEGIRTVYESTTEILESSGNSRRPAVVSRIKWWFIVVMILVTVLPTIIVTMGAFVWALIGAISSAYFNLLKKQYDSLHKYFLHALVPEPEPEPDYFNKLASAFADLIKRIDVSLFALLLAVIAILVSIWILSGVFYFSLRRITTRIRGIQYEAMRPGSLFVAGDIPRCQVQIKNPGLLVDSHQGYGIRVQNWLVVPLHVVNGFEDLVLVGPRGKILITTRFEPSRMHPDVAYMYLEQKQWVTLGNASASTSPALSGYVRCTGPGGYSSGSLSKTRAQGVMKYAGSTVMGMSGAAYMMADRVLGMHLGACGENNLGVSSTLFISELKYRTCRESVFLPSKNNGEDAAFVATSETWTAKLMDKIAKDAALSTSDSGWFGATDIDYDEQIDWEGGKKTDNPIKLATIMMQGQNGDGTNTEYVLVSAKMVDEIANLQERVGVLEEYIQARLIKEKTLHPCPECSVVTTSEQDLEKHKKKHVKWNCDLCSEQCSSEKRLENHKLSAHRKVVGESVTKAPSRAPRMIKESVYPGDARVLVQTDSFGRGRSSPVRRKRSSSRSSISSDGRRDSPLWEKLLSQMKESQKSLELLCAAVLRDMDGRNSATMQN